MRFATPQFFLVFLAVPVLIGFFIWTYQRKRAALHRFASLSMVRRLTPGVSGTKQIWKFILFVLFLMFVTLALVRPQFGVKMEMIERQGVDIIVALDVSRSMLAEDIAPNRLERAKHEIAKFIDLLKGDRVGLIVFAGESFLQCPLTLDYGAAKMFLDVVDTDWIQVQGTALAQAIQQASEAFKSKQKKHKVLVILSDGEDHEGDAVKAAKKAAGEGVKIYTVGIGSENGVPIPVRKNGTSLIYKKNKDGNLVMSKLNPLVLEKVSLEGKGTYFNAGTNLDLAHIYSEIYAMEKKDLGMNKMAVYEERYQIFLLIALAFLVMEFLVSERARVRKKWRGRFE